MIAYLRGKYRTRSGDEVVLDVQGVGYAVYTTGSVHVPAVGEELELVIYTDVKENSISLFGFSTQQEREVFLLLKKVSGIGSKTALNLISGVGAEELLRAIGSGDVSALTRVSGVGKKTAERVLVELREQVGELLPKREAGGRSPVAQVPPSGLSAAESDAVLALEKLGFHPDRARSAVNVALERPGGDVLDSGELLRLALAQLN